MWDIKQIKWPSQSDQPELTDPTNRGLSGNVRFLSDPERISYLQSKLKLELHKS